MQKLDDNMLEITKEDDSYVFKTFIEKFFNLQKLPEGGFKYFTRTNPSKIKNDKGKCCFDDCNNNYTKGYYCYGYLACKMCWDKIKCKWVKWYKNKDN